MRRLRDSTTPSSLEASSDGVKFSGARKSSAEGARQWHVLEFETQYRRRTIPGSRWHRELGSWVEHCQSDLDGGSSPPRALPCTTPTLTQSRTSSAARLRTPARSTILEEGDPGYALTRRTYRKSRRQTRTPGSSIISRAAGRDGGRAAPGATARTQRSRQTASAGALGPHDGPTQVPGDERGPVRLTGDAGSAMIATQKGILAWREHVDPSARCAYASSSTAPQDHSIAHHSRASVPHAEQSREQDARREPNEAPAFDLHRTAGSVGGLYGRDAVPTTAHSGCRPGGYLVGARL
jgi:hypothetical protein